MVSMSSLKSMPVGYRFRPTDEELINHYLKLKNQGADRDVCNIKEIDVCNWEPWDLSRHLGSESNDQEWYFFGRRDPKYAKSTRTNRSTEAGFWKITGKDRYIKSGDKKVIGTKKSIVFHRGRNRNGVRTNWVMHEYCALADKHNPQAYVLYLLMKKTDDSVKNPNIEGSANISSSDQSHHTQNWKEQEVFPDAVFGEDGDIDMQALYRVFGGQQPSWEGLDRMLPPIPLADVYPNQGTVHTTARFLNVSNNGSGVTQFQNIKREHEVVNSIDSAASHSLQTPDNVSFDSESGTETDNDVPQSLFGEDAAQGGPANHSDSESSNQEFYNDLILAHEVSLSANSDVTQPLQLKEDKGLKKLVSSEEVGESAISNQKAARTYSEVPAQAPGKKENVNPLQKKSATKSLEAASNHSSAESLLEEKSSTHLEVTGNKSSGTLEKSSDNTGFIVFSENPCMSNGTTPPSNYILNIAIGIFLTVVITGEVLFGLVS